jgi:hypothetical protein
LLTAKHFTTANNVLRQGNIGGFASPFIFSPCGGGDDIEKTSLCQHLGNIFGLPSTRYGRGWRLAPGEGPGLCVYKSIRLSCLAASLPLSPNPERSHLVASRTGWSSWFSPLLTDN